MDDDWLAALVTAERAIVTYDADPPRATAGGGLAVLRGQVPVLVSAPHATRHWRRSAWKREDEYTGAIAHWLHEQTGAHAMYPTHRINPDPHDDDDRGHFKQAMRDLIRAHGIRLVLDLHGARGDRDFALALGTIHGRTCARYEPAIVGVFRQAGFHVEHSPSSLDRLALNPPYFAGGARMPTVTRYAWDVLGVPAMQIEINAWARVVERLPDATEAQSGRGAHFRGDPVRIRRVLRGLLEVVAHVNGISAIE